MILQRTSYWIKFTNPSNAPAQLRHHIHSSVLNTMLSQDAFLSTLFPSYGSYTQTLPTSHMMTLWHVSAKQTLNLVPIYITSRQLQSPLATNRSPADGYTRITRLSISAVPKPWVAKQFEVSSGQN